MLFTDIEQKIKEGAYENKVAYPENNCLRLSYIFNEELSINENKKMVEDYNKSILKQRDKHHNEKCKLLDEFKADIINVLKDEYSFSEEFAKFVLEEADSGSSKFEFISMEEFIDSLRDKADFAKKLLEFKK